jgi:hypothetical protein
MKFFAMANIIKMWKMQSAAQYTYCLSIICYIALTKTRSPMKFPSVKNLFQSVGLTVERFPFESIFALAGTVAATIKIELTYTSRIQENWSLRAILVANLGLLLSLSATLFAESKGIAGSRKLLIRIATAIVAGLFIFIINPGEHGSDHIRFALLSLSFHLLVAFAAFTDKCHINGFWQFNKTLFLRFLTSALYGIVLFAGLSAAIGAMNFLFNFKFEWDTFSILFTWIVGIFSTLFFLAGVPGDFESLETDDSYPKGLKIFTQYVLIPLATVYVTILLAYEVKILLQWELPKGLVSNLILGYAVFGILSLLLVYPIREREENKWLKTYARYFYFLLIPLLGLLFAAAGTRIFRYGITEMRYFLIALAIWLLFITLYFLVAKKQSIKIIPISLSLLILLSAYGPQSAFSVAMHSQQRVLTGLFKKYKAFDKDQLMPVDSNKIKPTDASQAVATIDYLIDKHGLSSLQPFFKQDLDKIKDSLSIEKPSGNITVDVSDWELRWRQLEWITKQLGLHKFSQYDGYYSTIDTGVTVTTTYRFEIKNPVAIDIKGYDFIAAENKTNDDTTTYTINTHSCRQMVNNNTYALQINGQTAYFDVLKHLKGLVKDGIAHKRDNGKIQDLREQILPDGMLTLTQKIKGYTVTFKIKQAIFGTDGGEYAIESIDADYLVKKD